MVCESIERQEYDIACEVTQNFLADIMILHQLPIFDTFFEQMRQSTQKYTSRLYLLSLIMPLMSNRQARQFIKLINEQLDKEDPE